MHHHVPGSLACRWGRSRDSLASITTCTNICSKALHIPVCSYWVCFSREPGLRQWHENMKRNDSLWLDGSVGWRIVPDTKTLRVRFHPGTYLDCGFLPQSGHTGKANHRCFFSLASPPFLSLSLSLPLLLPFLSSLRSGDMPLGKD